jgi:hypothetical protein
MSSDSTRRAATRAGSDAPAPRVARGALAQELTVRQGADGAQIVVRRVVDAAAEGRGRTLHIDAVVR